MYTPMKLITAGFKMNADNWKWSTKGYLCLVGLVNVAKFHEMSI